MIDPSDLADLVEAITATEDLLSWNVAPPSIDEPDCALRFGVNRNQARISRIERRTKCVDAATIDPTIAAAIQDAASAIFAGAPSILAKIGYAELLVPIPDTVTGHARLAAARRLALPPTPAELRAFVERNFAPRYSDADLLAALRELDVPASHRGRMRAAIRRFAELTGLPAGDA